MRVPTVPILNLRDRLTDRFLEWLRSKGKRLRKVSFQLEFDTSAPAHRVTLEIPAVCSRGGE